MRDATWLEALDHELTIRGLTATDRAEALVQVEGHLSDAGVQALEHFGPPSVYADELARAAGLVPGQRRADAQADRTGGDPLLEAIGVTRSYRRRPVLAPVSMRVVPTQVVALIGDNGAGKSTLLRLLAGLESPDAGTIRRPAHVGYVPQSGGLDPWLRPCEHIELFGAARGLSRAEARRLGGHLAQQLGWDLSLAPMAGQLSGGTAQKLSVIVALIGSPQLLLLDEPYQGLDADSTRRFWDLLWATCDSGAAAVVSSHDPDVLRRADTVIELESVPR